MNCKRGFALNSQRVIATQAWPRMRGISKPFQWQGIIQSVAYTCGYISFPRALYLSCILTKSNASVKVSYLIVQVCCHRIGHLKFPLCNASQSLCVPSDRLPAPGRGRPFETPHLPLLGRQIRVILPIRGYIFQVIHLVLQPDAAVRVHGTYLV